MIHPLAWWVWALGLAVAGTRSTDPLVLGMLLAAVVVVVAVCRDDTPWARAFPAYLVLGLAIVLVRAGFYVLVGIKTPGPVLLDLPRVGLPGWAAAVELLGPVTVTGLLTAVSTGLGLAALVVCFGAANALAHPRRALRALPAALHQLGTAVVIAVSVTPQLVGSARDVRRAQRLRGHEPRGVRGLVSIVVPVLTDALDRSLALAASMDSRGYARTAVGRTDRRVAALVPAALVAVALGLYGLLDRTTPGWMGLPLLLGGAGGSAVAFVLAGRQVHRTRYRPDLWGAAESAVAGSGVLVAVTFVALGLADPGALTYVPGSSMVPSPPLIALLGVLVALLPALTTMATGPRRAAPGAGVAV